MPPTNLPRVPDSAAHLRQSVVTLARALRQETHGHFTPTQLSVFGSIYRHGPITLSALAARERLSAPTITKVVSVLEQQGIIDRISDPDDRRVCRVAVNAAGRRWADAHRAQRDAWLADQMARLTAKELATVTAAIPVLEKLIHDDG